MLDIIWYHMQTTLTWPLDPIFRSKGLLSGIVYLLKITYYKLIINL